MITVQFGGVAMRILVADSDWRLLRHVFGALGRYGHGVVVESAPKQALGIAQVFQPDLVIAPTYCLDTWMRTSSQSLKELLPDTNFLVTVHIDDDPSQWRHWTSRGCEVLMKPITHSSALLAAIDSATKKNLTPDLSPDPCPA